MFPSPARTRTAAAYTALARHSLPSVEALSTSTARGQASLPFTSTQPTRSLAIGKCLAAWITGAQQAVVAVARCCASQACEDTRAARVPCHRLTRVRAACARREPCPDRILDDLGAAFGMGAVGGGIWHFGKGVYNSPRGYSQRLTGGLAVRALAGARAVGRVWHHKAGRG